jgi:hypothetical protein
MNFTYKNNQTFKTTIGGIITLLSRFGIFIFFLILVFKIINKEMKVTFKQKFMSPSNSEQQSYMLSPDNFDIAYSV